MHLHLILLLAKVQKVEEPHLEELDSEVEEYKDLLDGLDVLISRLEKKRDHFERQKSEYGGIIEWREMDED